MESSECMQTCCFKYLAGMPFIPTSFPLLVGVIVSSSNVRIKLNWSLLWLGFAHQCLKVGSKDSLTITLWYLLSFLEELYHQRPDVGLNWVFMNQIQSWVNWRIPSCCLCQCNLPPHLPCHPYNHPAFSVVQPLFSLWDACVMLF